MNKLFVALAGAASISFAASAPHTHDGFFLNLGLGLGYGAFDYDYNYYDATLSSSGLSSELDVKLGGTIMTNTVLHLTLAGVTAQDELELEENDGDKVKTNSKSNITLLGVGVTYYLPQNFFFGASLGLSQFNVDSDDDGDADGSSDKGFGFQLIAGKEWWVSDEWALGLSASLIYGSAEDSDVGEISGIGFNVMFSATFH
ncbi:MAG: outer membrane beta-barrel protein [Fibrobacter sp.]|nr:outer membrane beta-barrel protein [Fibrobacter sp.]